MGCGGGTVMPEGSIIPISDEQAKAIREALKLLPGPGLPNLLRKA